ncbi:urease accessory protein UreD [Rubritalea spongiae]|uniref:Urease accessory protein UreD n=1 Tax=Rubritalea spongiae TaxID=430797 RepID=A0ABW5E2Q1_9BACT
MAARTQMVERKLGGLSHASKAYHDGDFLSLQLVNPTAGLFAGDSLEIDLSIGERANVSLTSPSATRFHTMGEGEHSDFIQRVVVGEQAVLDYWPEMVIAQRGATVHQSTMVQLAADARMVLLDSLAPGRIAHGENNAYRKYRNGFDIKVGERLIARERMELMPVDGDWQLLAPDWKQCYIASVWCFDQECVQHDSEFEREIRALALEEGCLCAYSDLGEGLAVVRVLAENSVNFRRILDCVREVALKHIVRYPIQFRKL